MEIASYKIEFHIHKDFHGLDTELEEWHDLHHLILKRALNVFLVVLNVVEGFYSSHTDVEWNDSIRKPFKLKYQENKEHFLNWFGNLERQFRRIDRTCALVSLYFVWRELNVLECKFLGNKKNWLLTVHRD